MTDIGRIYERPLARAHALAEQWTGDLTPITRSEAAELLYAVLDPSGWTETETQAAHLAATPPSLSAVGGSACARAAQAAPPPPPPGSSPMPDTPEPVCPSECDPDCEVGCHEHHAIPRLRHHDPYTCPGNNVPTPEPPMPDDTTPALRDRLLKVVDDADGHSCMYQEGIDAGEITDAVLAVVQPVIDKAQRRAEATEAMTAEVTEALRRANRELDAAATKWDLDLDKRTADLTQRAEAAEAALARVRDLVADMQGVTGVRWWAALLAAALAPPVPADQPEGGAR